MAGNRTQFNQADVLETAKQHDTTAEELRQRLRDLRTDIGDGLAVSDNAMMRKLMERAEDWTENVEKDVIGRLNIMADAMRREIGAQENLDEDHGGAIDGLTLETQGFLTT